MTNRRPETAGRPCTDVGSALPGARTRRERLPFLAFPVELVDGLAWRTPRLVHQVPDQPLTVPRSFRSSRTPAHASMRTARSPRISADSAACSRAGASRAPPERGEGSSEKSPWPTDFLSSRRPDSNRQPSPGKDAVRAHSASIAGRGRRGPARRSWIARAAAAYSASRSS
jgi:hypothetical protein